MKTLLNKSQQTLNQIQSQIKSKLQEIQYLDVKCLRIQCHLEQLREIYLQQIKYEYIDNENEQHVNIEDIAKLEEELKQTAQKKVNIAEQIQRIVAKYNSQIQNKIHQTADQFAYGTVMSLREDIKNQHLSQFGMTKNKTKQNKIMSSQIKSIVKQYYDEKETYIGQSYCICKPNGTKIFSGSMIQCQNPNCKVGWYHFECVGIKSCAVPQNWLCQTCESEIKKVKKIIFEHENDKVEVEVNNQDNLKTQQVPLKRKRGRPRKYFV